MHDRQYRWQDHVPPSVGLRADLIFAALFLVAVIAFGSHERAQNEAALHQSVTHSIARSASTHTGHIAAARRADS